jgi:hypothetical protein
MSEVTASAIREYVAMRFIERLNVPIVPMVPVVQTVQIVHGDF